MPATRDVGHSKPRRRPKPKPKPKPYILPAGPRGDVGTGSGYHHVPTPPLRPGRGSGRRYVLPTGAPRGDAGHSVTPAQRAAINRGVRDARLRVLRKRAREKPRGIPTLAQQLSEFVVHHAYVPNTGGGFSGVTALNAKATRRPLGRGAATVLAPRPIAVSSSPIASAVVRDALALGTGPFVGGYTVGSGLYQLAHGRPGQLKALAKGTGKAIAASAPGELVQGHPKAALKALEEHPLLSALDFAGAESLVGRTGGALVRAAGKRGAPGVRGKLADIGSTVRSPVALTGDAGAVRSGSYLQRTKSKDLIRSGVQHLVDRKTREVLRDSEGRPVTVHDRGRDVAVVKPRTQAEQDFLLRREGNMDSGAAISRERHDRELAQREARVRGRLKANGVHGRTAQDLVMLATEGVLRTSKTFREDAYKEWQRLLKSHKAALENGTYRHRGEAALVGHRIALLDKAIHDQRVSRQAPAIIAEGERLGRQLNEGDRQLLKARVLTDAQRARRSALIPAAISHGGARHFTVEEHRALEAEAQAREDAAVAKLEEAQRAPHSNLRPVHLQALRDAVKRAREERYAVSGRHPVKQAAHEHWKREEERLQRKYHSLSTEHARLWKRRRDIVASQRVRRGQAGAFGRKGTETAARSAARGAKQLEKVDARLKVLREEMREAKGQHRNARARLARAPEAPIRAGIRTPEGKFLPNRAIEDQHLASVGRDPASVAYVPHRQDILGARAFHRQPRPGVRPVMDAPELRTGEAHRKGAVLTSRDVLEQQGVKQRVQLAQAAAQDRLVRTAGVRHPAFAKAQAGKPLTKDEEKIVKAGGAWTMKEALEASQRLHHDDNGNPILELNKQGYPILHSPSGERLVPMRMYAGRLSAEAKAVIRENLQGPAGMDSLGLRLMNDRVVRDVTGERNVVLVPATRVEQMERHLRSVGEVEKFFQLLNRPFRFAVLATTHWLGGNFAEPYIVRLTGVGSGVNVFGLARDVTAANRILKIMERSPDRAMREAAAQIRAEHFMGLAGSGRGLMVRRGVEDFPLAYGKVISRLPVVREGFQALRQIGHLLMEPGNLFFRANRVIEGLAQRGAFGHEVVRSLQEFEGSWVKSLALHRSALEEVAKGLVDTPTQRRFLREQHILLGKYEGFSPGLRRLTQSIMPFLPWALNAARFVYWTMPAHRSLQTALLMKVNEVVSQSWQDQHADVPPGTLKMAIPTKDGGWIDLARYLPYGLTAATNEGDFQGLTGQVAPQFSGALAAVQGRDPFGRELKTSGMVREGRTQVKGGEKLGVGVYGLAESFTPYLNYIRRAREGGSTAYADSTAFSPKVKPGTKHMGAANRILNPLRPTYLGAGSSGFKIPPQQSGAPTIPGLSPAASRALHSRAVSPSTGLSPEAERALRAIATGR